ncbi:MAG: hypothetical protein P8L85_05180 [Rubripirellula sp.]|nr:hypothetical protein [Rubripirellula sp.]
MAVSTSDQITDESVITIDRRREDRRSEQGEASQEVTPRPKKQRRRHIDPTTCERDYSEQEIEFMRAMDDYKRDAGRMFPTCSEVLEVIRALGYYQLSDDQLEDLGLVQFETEGEQDVAGEEGVAEEQEELEDTLA